VRRLAPFAVVAAFLAGCSATVPGGGHHVTTPTPQSVVGPLPNTSGPAGNAANGKTLFAANACGSCHTYAPAGATGKVGPDLDTLAEQAKKANHGTVEQFALQSIVAPASYIAPGFPNAMPPSYGKTLSKQQLADLVAFLTKSRAS
jgi:cytochrome c551/c552